VSAVSKELENPKDWEPREPESEEQSWILNAIRNLVSDNVDKHCRSVLVSDPRKTAWLPAYENIGGQGTKVRRAMIARCRAGAPLIAILIGWLQGFTMLAVFP
jgi:hypothetical protein